MALDFPASPGNGQQFTGPGGVIWVYDGAKWISGTLATGAYMPITTDTGRNLAHNSAFFVQQRGAGSWTTSLAMTADRWQMQFQNGSMTTTIAPITVASAQVIGDESARFALQAVVVGTGGAGDSDIICQRMPDVRGLAGKTVTVSFWAIATTGTPKIGVNLYQFFGAGGSAGVQGAGQAVTISTTWTRYSLTFAIASVSGLTIGTGSDDYTRLTFWLSAGTGIFAPSGGIPTQSNTFSLWGVQVENGITATPLERSDYARDYPVCARYYQVIPGFIFSYSAAGTGLATVMYPVGVKGPTPAVAITGQTYSNASGLTSSGGNTICAQVTATFTAAGWAAGNITITADL